MEIFLQNILITGRYCGRITGGIVGRSVGDNIIIENCINYGNVMSDVELSGGIIGMISYGKIKNCNNEGNIISKSIYSGGIVGKGSSCSIKNCSNSGEIFSGSCVGGIIGDISSEFEIEECKNIGKIVANNQIAGGIVGSSVLGIIKKCNNEGNVECNAISSRGVSGGIVGMLNGNVTIEECFNKGIIKVGDFLDKLDVAGGIVGFQTGGGSIKYCYNQSEILGEVAGGIIGQYNNVVIAEIIKNYYFNNKINGIGSEGNDNNVIVMKENSVDVVEKVTDMDILDNYERFVEWIANKK